MVNNTNKVMNEVRKAEVNALRQELESQKAFYENKIKELQRLIDSLVKDAGIVIKDVH
ncbi:MAG: hypothetical protein KBT03_13600 [Bacteroidales bacterium]|nr:hypothetical protein [Candidatus Scybalousia scybalohippi]